MVSKVTQRPIGTDLFMKYKNARQTGALGVHVDFLSHFSSVTLTPKSFSVMFFYAVRLIDAAFYV